MKLRKGDTVTILAGKDRGKEGIVERVLARDEKVVVAGVNIMKRHSKPSRKYPSGGIVEIAYPIHQSNIKVVSDDANKAKTTKKVTR